MPSSNNDGTKKDRDRIPLLDVASRRPTKILIDERPLYKNTAAVSVLVVAVTTIIGVAIQFRQSVTDVSPIAVNVQLVVDLSEVASVPGESIGRARATLAAVEAALGRLSSADNLALRRIGGTCDSSGTRLLVPFAAGNHSSVLDELRGSQIRGERALVRAVLEATGDFNDVKRFPPTTTRKIILITGGEDTCKGSYKSPGEGSEVIRTRLQEAAIRADLVVIGYRVGPRERERLSQIANAAGGRIRFEDRAPELATAVAQEINLVEVIAAPASGVPLLPPTPITPSAPLLAERETGPVAAPTDPVMAKDNPGSASQPAYPPAGKSFGPLDPPWEAETKRAFRLVETLLSAIDATPRAATQTSAPTNHVILRTLSDLHREASRHNATARLALGDLVPASLLALDSTLADSYLLQRGSRMGRPEYESTFASPTSNGARRATESRSVALEMMTIVAVARFLTARDVAAREAAKHESRQLQLALLTTMRNDGTDALFAWLVDRTGESEFRDEVPRHYETAARNGNARSAYELGRIHGQQGNTIASLEWMRIAARLGHEEARTRLRQQGVSW